MPASRTVALADARKLARSIVEDPAYKTMLIARANAGELAPAVETLLFHYAYGKPSDVLEVNNISDELRSREIDELLGELDATRDQLLAAVDAKREAQEILRRVAEQKAIDGPINQPQNDNVAHFADFAKMPSRPH